MFLLRAVVQSSFRPHVRWHTMTRLLELASDITTICCRRIYSQHRPLYFERLAMDMQSRTGDQRFCRDIQEAGSLLASDRRWAESVAPF